MKSEKTVVIDALSQSPFRHMDCDAVVCIDVMLSSTTLATAVAQGRRAFVARDLEEARAVAGRLGDVLLAGSDDARLIPGFALTDGPVALLRRSDVSQPLVLVSPPATDLMLDAAGCGNVFVACFRNLTATAAHLNRCAGRVALLAAGVREEFSCEDQMAAAWLADRLQGWGFAPGDRRTGELTRRWSGIEPHLAGWGNSAAQLGRAGQQEEVEFVLAHQDDLSFAVATSGGEVYRAPRAEGGRDRLPQAVGGVPASGKGGC